MDVGAGCTREMTGECPVCDEGLVNHKKKKKKDDAAKAAKEAAAQGATVEGLKPSAPGPSVEPRYSITLGEVDEEGDTWMKVQVELPGVRGVEDVTAGLVNMKFLELETKPLKHDPQCYRMRLELPHFVDDEDMECTFDKRFSKLTIRAPLVGDPPAKGEVTLPSPQKMGLF